MTQQNNVVQEKVSTTDTAPVAPQEALSEHDKMVLEVAKMNRKLALANAEKALAQNNEAESTYKYLLLQLYMKYGMNTETDALDEQSNILRNALVKKD